jgi:hypothetical protein
VLRSWFFALILAHKAAPVLVSKKDLHAPSPRKKNFKKNEEAKKA